MRSSTEKPAVASVTDCSPRREEILDAATEMFAANGYAGTDTQALVERLQVGKGTLYRHFPSKRALFLAAVDRGMHCLRKEVEANISEVDDPMEKVARGVKTFLTFFTDRPEFFELIIQERALFKDRTAPTYLEIREDHVKRWQDVYRTLIAERRIRDMPVERISAVVSGVLYGTMFINYFMGRTKSPEAQAEDILDVVLHGILAPSDRRSQGGAAPEGTPG